MKSRSGSIGCFCFILASLSCVACDRDASKTAAEKPPVATAAPTATAQPAPSATAAASAAPAKPTKPDPVAAADLNLGLTAMTPRLVAQTDGLTKVAPDDRSRFFMHPDVTKNPSLEFDAKGLNSLEMSPFMGDFSHSADCATNTKAGIVKLTWFIDGKKKGQVTVDQAYKDIVKVNLANATRFKVEVDKGNDVTWCDWFSLGFLNVK